MYLSRYIDEMYTILVEHDLNERKFDINCLEVLIKHKYLHEHTYQHAKLDKYLDKINTYICTCTCTQCMYE